MASRKKSKQVEEQTIEIIQDEIALEDDISEPVEKPKVEKQKHEEPKNESVEFSEEYQTLVRHFVRCVDVANLGKLKVSDNILKFDGNKIAAEDDSVGNLQCFNFISKAKDPKSAVAEVLRIVKNDSIVVMIDKDYNHLEHLFAELKHTKVMYCGQCSRLLQSNPYLKFLKANRNLSALVFRKG